MSGSEEQQDGGGDSNPGEEQLFAGDGAAHENDDERRGDGENLRGHHGAEARTGGRERKKSGGFQYTARRMTMK